MPTGLENELMNDSTVGDLPFEEEVVTYNGNRDYDPGPNTGSYGFVEVEIDGQVLECTNAYMSNAYGGQYCVGDNYVDPNGGTQVIRSINPTGLDLAPAQWDAEETYAGAGEKMGMTLEQWTEFSAEVQALNEQVDSLKGNMFGPTEQERGRLGIRISQANPDWTEEQVWAEVDRMLEEQWTTSEAYAEAAAAETALFQQYGIQKDNPGVYGSGIYIDSEGKYHKFESSSGNYYQTSQDDSILDVAVPVGIGVITGIITGGAASALTSSLLPGLSSVASGALNSAIASSASTLLQGGELTLEGVLEAAALGGASTAILDEIRTAVEGGEGVLSDIAEWVGEQTDKLYDQKVVTLPDGSVVIETANGWVDSAGNVLTTLPAGGTPGTISGILGQGGTIPDWVWDGAQAVVDGVDAVAGAGEGSGVGGGNGGSTTLPDLTPEEEVDEVVQEQEELEEQEEELEEEEEEVVVTPEEEVEEEVEEEIVNVDNELDDEKDGGWLGNIFDDIFNSVPDDDPEEEEVVVTPPPPADPPASSPGGSGNDDLNEDEEEPPVIIVDPPVTPPVSGPGEPPGGGDSGMLSGGGDFTPTWTPLFETGTVDVYKAPPLRSLFKDYL